jgi:hypothetical protein
MMRAGETPYASRPQPDQIYRDRNSSPAEPAGYSLPGNGPFLLNRQVPGRKFVIAVCLGEIWRSHSSPSGSGSGREGDVLDAVVDAAGGVGHSKSRSIRAAAA